MALVLSLAPATMAQQPITGLGPQLRLTQVGPDGDNSFDATDPALAYNPEKDEFLLVWAGDVSIANDRTEVSAQLLDGAGNPKGNPIQLTDVGPGPGLTATDPAVIYAPSVDSYIVAYSAGLPAGGREIFARRMADTGLPLPAGQSNPVQISTTDPTGTAVGFAQSPALALDTGSDPNQVRFVWRANADDNDVTNNEIYTRRFHVDLTNPFGQIRVSTHDDAFGIPDEPAIVFVPGAARYLFVWETDDVEAGHRDVFAELTTLGGTEVVGQVKISSTGALDDAELPEAVLRPGTPGEFLVAFVKDAPEAGTGQIENQVFVQRLAADTLTEPAPEQQVSALADGVIASGRLGLAYEPGLDRYLVTWTGDAVPGESERYGQALDGSGNQVERDDFQISTTGPPGSTLVGAEEGAVAANTTRRQWLNAWSADEVAPPFADNEFEIFGRLAGENFDLDGDGSPVPVDCDDGNASIFPGATDVPDNGVDEDCSGADAVNLDRDGDGSPRPADCNDANPFIRPGATDIAGNGVDEDCSGADTPLPPRPLQVTNAGITFTFRFFRSFTRFTSFNVVRARRGMRIQLRCRGRGCPRGLRRRTTIRVRRSGTVRLIRRFGRARLRPRAVVEIRLIQPGRIGRVFTLTIRSNRAPRQRSLCLRPGASRPTRCPT